MRSNKDWAKRNTDYKAYIMQKGDKMKKKLTFKDYLMEQHAEQFIGTKDMMIDDFPDWLDDLEIDDWFKFGDKFIFDKIKEINQLKEKIRQDDYTFMNIAEKCGDLQTQIEDIRNL